MGAGADVRGSSRNPPGRLFSRIVSVPSLFDVGVVKLRESRIFRKQPRVASPLL